MNLKTLISVATISIIGAMGCTKENVTCDDSNITYESNIKSIFASSCNFPTCHNSGSVNGSLASYDDVKVFPKKDRIVGAINYAEGYAKMPPLQKLSDCDIAKIEKWVANGLPQ